MTALETLAERVARGEPIAEEDAALILESHDLLTIGAMADDMRRRLHGTATTFVRVLEVHVEAPPASLPPGTAAGEVRLVGRPSSAASLLPVIRSIAALAGAVPVTGFSLADLIALASSDDVPLEGLAVQLRDAGLYAVAELPLDVVEDAAGAVQKLRGAGLAVHRLTVQSLTAGTRLTLVQRARDLQETCGGFLAFAPLPRVVPVAAPTTGFDDVKQVAIARLVATNIASIQVDWPLYGPKLAQVALTMGADDVDGIEAADPGVLGTRRSAVEEIRGNIRAAALQPVERNGRFEVVA